MQLPKEGTKKHNKHRHKVNPRIIDYEPCQLCGMYPAVITHEIFHNNSAYMRNLSINYHAQLNLCNTCHTNLHNNPLTEKAIRAEHQQKIMTEHQMSDRQWLGLFYQDYL